MIRSLTTLTLLVTPLAAAQGVPSSSAPRQDELATKIARVEPEELTAEVLAVFLLEAELEAVTIWLDDLALGPRRARRSPGRAADLDHFRRRTGQVPAVLRGLLSRSTIPAEAHAHALALGIEILRAKRSPAGFRELAELVESATRMAPDRAGEAPERLERAIGDATSLRLYGLPDLERLYRHAPDPLRRSVLDGVAAGSNPDFSASALVRLLGSVPESDPSVLNRVHLALQRRPAGPAPDVSDAVAAYLDDSRPFARHEAAACLARIGEREHVRPLIKRLNDVNATVGTAAHAALHRLTGMTLPPDAERWSQWFDGQLAWWDAEGRVQLDELTFAPRSGQLAILRDVCTKRLFHEEIAVSVGGLLHGSDTPTLCLALSALGTLRSPSALNLVRSYVDHPEAAVREAALAALRSYQQAQGCLAPRAAGISR